MFFTKYPHPANFSFVNRYEADSGEAEAGNRTLQLHAAEHEDGVIRLRLTEGDRWAPNRALMPLDLPPAAELRHLQVEPNGDFRLVDGEGKPLLRSMPRAGIGVSGSASLFQFQVPTGALFYGLGGKKFPRIEHSGIRTCFWNVDMWSDFHPGQWGAGETDPTYFTTPYLAIRLETGWVGMLLDNPSPGFISTPGTDDSRVFVEWQQTPEALILGTVSGEPNLVLFVAKTLAELTRKLQRAVGVAPLPPMWALGFHQSRWGYGGVRDLRRLDRRFRRAGIPCDAFWLDLDYMDGYRVFSVSQEMFPRGTEGFAKKLAGRGRRIVPILDPGIKREAGYEVFDDGLAKGLFCLNQEGAPYVGLVWPGETVFPDFTLPEARAWWAERAARFRGRGFAAAWVDMNDPSTGPVDPEDMLFERGQVPHAEHRNQYALGMQMATREGFVRAEPKERPFVLSRSGFTGSSRVSAIWTGDNCANDFYLGLSIPEALNMALSGLSFSGCDVGGFGGASDEALMTRWTQACFLFPFFRNHSTKSDPDQEPFVYPERTRKVLAHYIRLRYRLLPYLYQLFVRQEEREEPVLRPMLYEFEEAGMVRVADQMMVGPWLLHAPILQARGHRREVVLPGKDRWWDARTGAWVSPGRHVVEASRKDSPLYVRLGGIVPLQRKLPREAKVELLRPAFLVVCSPGQRGNWHESYVADDGLTLAYREGARSRLEVTTAVRRRKLAMAWSQEEAGFGRIEPVFLVPPGFEEVTLNGRKAHLVARRLRLTGNRLDLQRVVAD